MTDPLAYGEGLGGSVIILATFLGVIGLVQVAAYVRDRLRARRQSQSTIGRNNRGIFEMKGDNND